jgi:hypothetical protein
MGARNPIDNMTLFEAYRIQLGGRPAGGTRTLRDECRTIAYGTARHILALDCASRAETLSPAQWAQLANLPRRPAAKDASGLLPERTIEATLRWIASAPQTYAGMAIEIGLLRTSICDERKLFASLLGGEAGPHAYAAVPMGQFYLQSERIGALLGLPQQDLEAITAPHAGDWPCYADRIIATSSFWEAPTSDELFKSLSRLASEDAAEWAVWLARFGGRVDATRLLLSRFPPSPQMLEIVERFGKPEAARELLAAHVGRQLQAEIPAGDDDLLPHTEMI